MPDFSIACFGLCFPPQSTIGILLLHLEKMERRTSSLWNQNLKVRWFAKLAGATVISERVSEPGAGTRFSAYITKKAGYHTVFTSGE